ncbi:MAG: hypothetical protein B6I20_07925 [Bacteroidetes bacterium 4572_117]|nr:MAG: hypothetical protein B6I20_07925 [Bacteroidetes bacterium 4572_117]
MKHFSFIIIFFVAIIFSSCGAKEETASETDADSEIMEVPDTLDYAGNEEFIADESDLDINPVDSTLQENMNYDENTNEVQVDPPVEVKEKPVVVKEEKPVVEEVKVHQKRYYIVVGSFKKSSNAENLNNYFKKKGYRPMILPKVNGYNRVAISSFVEKANAKKNVIKLRKEYNDLTFWIYQW